MDNKEIFSINLKRLMERKGVSRQDLSKVLGVSYFTISDWVNGKKYPRMDKVELLADYFGVLKSDLIEDKGTNKTLPQEQELTEGEELLLELFRQIPDDAQKMYLEVLRASLKKQP
jgi:transcriptional regulator with XRE-family HTH domain